MAEEIWKPVVGFEGAYEVSDRGQVRSLDRVIQALNRWGEIRPRRMKGRILSPLVNHARGGYLYVNLHRDGEQTLRAVHVLVAAAFISPRPEGSQVCHNDGIVSHNDATNLRYGSAQSNSDDRYLHGTHGRGEQHSQARLSAEDIVTIRDRGYDRRALARRFDVHPTHIDSIRSGRRWGHV